MDILFIVKMIGTFVFFFGVLTVMAYIILVARDNHRTRDYMFSWDWLNQSNRKSDLKSILDEARKHCKNCAYCGNNEFLVESLWRGYAYRARHTLICSTCGFEHNMIAKRILRKMKRSKTVQKILF